MLGLFSHAVKILEHDARIFADFIHDTRRAVSLAAKSLTLGFQSSHATIGYDTSSKKLSWASMWRQMKKFVGGTKCGRTIECWTIKNRDLLSVHSEGY